MGYYELKSLFPGEGEFLGFSAPTAFATEPKIPPEESPPPEAPPAVSEVAESGRRPSGAAS